MGHNRKGSAHLDPDVFAEVYGPYALEAGRKTGINPETILAQAAMESNWGGHAGPRGANNLLGIKTPGNGMLFDGAIGKTSRTPTREGKNRQNTVRASFQKFAKPEDTFKAYAHMAQRSFGRYGKVREEETPQKQAYALAKAGYATHGAAGYSKGVESRRAAMANTDAFREMAEGWSTHQNRDFPSELARAQAFRDTHPEQFDGYTPAPRDAYTVQPQDRLTQRTFDQIYEGMPAYEAPATFDERYAPSGPMPPGSFGDFLGSYGNDHLIGADFGNFTPTGTVEDRRGGRPGGGGLHPGFQPDLGGIDLDRIEQAHSIWNEDRRFSDVFSAMPYAGISAPLYGEEAAFPTKEQSFFPMSLTDWGIGPETGIPPAANWEKAAAFPHPENFDRWDEDNFSAPVWGAQEPASAGFFNAPLEQPTVSPTQFSNAYTAPMTGPASMAYGVDIGQPAPDPFAPEPAPDWFSDRLAEPSLYGSSFGLDTAMAGSRTSPTAPGQLGSEITPEYTAHVPEASQQILDSYPDHDHLGAPPMGGYTPPAPPQDYTAPPSMLASMDIGGSTADRLRSPSGYGSDYMTPSFTRDPMEGARDRLTAGLAERFGATASAAIPQAPPQAPPRAPDPVSRFTERTVYDTKMVPEKYTVDVPVERSFSKANVGTALGAKPTGFADLGFMSGLMTGNPWSDSLHQKAQNVTQPQSAPPRAQPQSAPPQMRREERTRMVEQRTPRTIREVVKDMQPPTRPAMARPEVPSFTRPVSMQEMGINPIGAGSWGFNAFEPPAPSISQSFSMAGNSLLGGLSDSILSGLGYGPDSSFTGGWGGGWGEGGPGGYGGGSVYDGNSGPYAGGDARFDGGWGGLSDGDTYR
jgi:hypothetical protein